MFRLTTLAIPLVLVVTTGCLTVDLNDPARAISNAELSGNLTVFTYFAANKEDAKNAQKYLTAIETIEENISGKPAEGGFSSLTDLVHKKLEEQLTGADAAFLPGAKSLSRILLLKLDQDVPLPKIEPSEEVQVILDIVKAFLKGAKTALSDFIPN